MLAHQHSNTAQARAHQRQGTRPFPPPPRRPAGVLFTTVGTFMLTAGPEGSSAPGGDGGGGGGGGFGIGDICGLVRPQPRAPPRPIQR